MTADRRHDPTSRKAQAARRPAIVPVRTASPSPVQPGAGPARRVDLLAVERANDRISEAQFIVGRMIQAAFERGSGARLGSIDWSATRSPGGSAAQDLAIILRLQDADRIRRFSARLEAEIGRAGVRVLRAILAEGHSFQSYAAACGQGSARGAHSIGDRFRWLLAALVEARHTATGPERSAIRGEAC